MTALDLILQLVTIIKDHGNLEVKAIVPFLPEVGNLPVGKVFLPYEEGKPQCIVLLP